MVSEIAERSAAGCTCAPPARAECHNTWHNKGRPRQGRTGQRTALSQFVLLDILLVGQLDARAYVHGNALAQQQLFALPYSMAGKVMWSCFMLSVVEFIFAKHGRRGGGGKHAEPKPSATKRTKADYYRAYQATHTRRTWVLSRVS